MNWNKLSEEKPARNDTCWVMHDGSSKLAWWDNENQCFWGLLYNCEISIENITHWAYAVELPEPFAESEKADFFECNECEQTYLASQYKYCEECYEYCRNPLEGHKDKLRHIIGLLNKAVETL